ncbi:MAG: hypothetical protein IT384_16040 [Deltaproteobacteria bacterium]|nr:hypothetical protein [Deltaproteobacteria bacterium]
MALCLCGVAAACVPSQPSVQLELPSVEGAASYVLGVESGGEWLGARAERIEEPLWIDGLREDTVVRVLVYDTALEAMALARGLVPPPGDCARSCGLLAPRRVLRAAIAANGSPIGPGWIEERAVGEPLATTLVGPERCGRRGCLRHQFQDLDVPGAAEMRWATPDGPGSVLVGDVNGAVFRVAINGSIERVCLSGSDRVTEAAKAGRDRLWMGGRGWVGALDLSTTTPTAACQPYLRVPLGEAGDVRAITASEPGEVAEAFVVADDSSSPHAEALLFRVTGGVAEELARRPLDARDLVPPNTGMRNASVVRLAPGRAAAVFSGSEVLWLSSGPSGVRVEPLPLGLRIMSIAVSEPLGVVLASENRFLLWRGPDHVESRAPGGAWSEVAAPPGSGKPLIVLPHGRRVTVTWEGAMTELVDGSGYCAAELLSFGVGGYSPAAGALFGDGGAFTIARLPQTGRVIVVRPPPLFCGDEND